MQASRQFLMAVLAAAGCSSNDGTGSSVMSHDAAAGGASIVVVPDASPGSDTGATPASDSATFDVAVEIHLLPMDAGDAKMMFADYQPITDGGLQEIKLYPGDPPNFRAGAPP